MSLLIDMRGRLFAHSPTRSLFDCRQQLERAALHTLPQPYGDGWYAPGIQADEPGLSGTLHGHDYVIFDAGPIRTAPALMPDARHTVIIEVQPAHESGLRAYALLKTLSHADTCPDIALLGEPASCDHVLAACSRFLEPAFTQALYNAAHEEDAIAALAIRIVGGVGDNTNLMARHLTRGQT